MEQLSFEQRLKSLWQQGSRDVAISFLRRALSTENTLEEVLLALQFAGVQEYLDNIRLGEIFGAVSPGSGTADAVPVRIKRRRRSAEEMKRMRNSISTLLSKEAGSLNTSEICHRLQQQGDDVDTIRVSLLLKALEAEGHVTDLGGKPKSWRFAGPGRRAAEPMFIKKKHAS